jgi:hypothetical protein
MKFVRVAAFHYSSAIKMVYGFNSSLISASYEEQLKALFSLRLNYSDAFTKALLAYGYEAQEILYDVYPLQSRWAQEQGFSFQADLWQQEILIRQIQTLEPTVLLLHNVQILSDSILKQRRTLFPSVETLVIFRGYPEIDRQLYRQLRQADLILAGSPTLHQLLQRHNLPVHLFYHSFDERILASLPSLQAPTIPCSFVGTSGYGYGWNHQPRYHYLHELLQKTNLMCWLDEPEPHSPHTKLKRGLESLARHLPPLLLQRCKDTLYLPQPCRKIAFNALAFKQATTPYPTEPLQKLFPQSCAPSRFGLGMYQTLQSSYVTFNKHTFAAMGCVDNIRLFEATGVGSCLLTDAGSNLGDLFSPGEEVMVYRNLAECLDILKELLACPSKALTIGKRGQKKTLTCHTVQARAFDLHRWILQSQKAR